MIPAAGPALAGDRGETSPTGTTMELFHEKWTQRGLGVVLSANVCEQSFSPPAFGLFSPLPCAPVCQLYRRASGRVERGSEKSRTGLVGLAHPCLFFGCAM